MDMKSSLGRLDLNLDSKSLFVNLSMHQSSIVNSLMLSNDIDI